MSELNAECLGREFSNIKQENEKKEAINKLDFLIVNHHNEINNSVIEEEFREKENKDCICASTIGGEIGEILTSIKVEDKMKKRVIYVSKERHCMADLFSKFGFLDVKEKRGLGEQIKFYVAQRKQKYISFFEKKMNLEEGVNNNKPVEKSLVNVVDSIISAPNKILSKAADFVTQNENSAKNEQRIVLGELQKENYKSPNSLTKEHKTDIMLLGCKLDNYPKFLKCIIKKLVFSINEIPQLPAKKTDRIINIISTILCFRALQLIKEVLTEEEVLIDYIQKERDWNEHLSERVYPSFHLEDLKLFYSSLVKSDPLTFGPFILTPQRTTFFSTVLSLQRSKIPLNKMEKNSYIYKTKNIKEREGALREWGSLNIPYSEEKTYHVNMDIFTILFNMFCLNINNPRTINMILLSINLNVNEAESRLIKTGLYEYVSNLFTTIEVEMRSFSPLEVSLCNELNNFKFDRLYKETVFKKNGNIEIMPIYDSIQLTLEFDQFFTINLPIMIKKANFDYFISHDEIKIGTNKFYLQNTQKTIYELNKIAFLLRRETLFYKNIDLILRSYYFRTEYYGLEKAIINCGNIANEAVIKILKNFENIYIHRSKWGEGKKTVDCVYPKESIFDISIENKISTYNETMKGFLNRVTDCDQFGITQSFTRNITSSMKNLKAASISIKSFHRVLLIQNGNVSNESSLMLKVYSLAELFSSTMKYIRIFMENKGLNICFFNPDHSSHSIICYLLIESMHNIILGEMKENIRSGMCEAVAPSKNTMTDMLENINYMRDKIKNSSKNLCHEPIFSLCIFNRKENMARSLINFHHCCLKTSFY